MSSPLSLSIFTDGGSRGNPGPAALGVAVFDSAENVVHDHQFFLGDKTNNEAEYEAFLYSLIWLKEFSSSHEIKNVVWNLDSKLVVEQLNKKWKIKEPRMQVLAQKIWDILKTLSLPCEIHHIPREKNSYADRLVNQALDAALHV